MHYAVNGALKHNANKTKLTATEGGTYVTRSFEECMYEDILKLVPKRKPAGVWLQNQFEAKGIKLEINVLGDAVLVFRGVNCTHLATRFPQFKEFASSPAALTHLGMFEGKDNWPELWKAFKETREFHVKSALQARWAYTCTS